MKQVDADRTIEVAGNCANSVIDAFKQYQLLVSQLLLQEGVGREISPGVVRSDPKGWYPLPSFLRALERTRARVGDSALLQIGLAVPANAIFPPSVTDIHSAIASIDVAFHMNHRKRGEVMFDPRTGGMQDGIGHYGCEPVSGKKEIVCVVTSPYPCPYDHGIITTMARRFEKLAQVRHEDGKGCRDKGGTSCTYRISWT